MRAAFLALAVILGGLGVGVGQQAAASTVPAGVPLGAHFANAATATPAPSPSPRLESRIAISLPTSNSFVSGTVVTLSGSKDADTSVLIRSVTGDDEPLCETPTDSSTSWTCRNVTLPSGTIGLQAIEFIGADETARSAEIALRVLGSPAIRGTGTVINAGSLDGVGWNGASIRVAVTSPVASVEPCGQVDSNGYWYCGLTLPSGEYRVQVEQSWPGSTSEWSPASASRVLIIDSVVPAAPSIVAPRSGDRIAAQPARYAGTGENAALVDVFADDQYVCTARVTAGSWECTGSGVTDGNHRIKAIQRDAAENVSSPSVEVGAVYGTATGSIPAAPSPAAPAAPSAPSSVPPPSDGAVPAPVVPAPAPSPSPAAPVSPDSTDSSGLIAPGGTFGSTTQAWGIPTQYGSAIVSPLKTLERGTWPLGLLLALGWLVLIALPLRLLATALRGRDFHGPPQLTGRNRFRPREEPSGPQANPYFVAGGALVGATLLAVMASGIEGEVRYLRLTVAVAAGLAIANLAVVLSTAAAARWVGVSRGIRLVPTYLAIGAGTALLSRISDIQPPLIVGVVVGATFATGIAARTRGTVNLVQIGTLAILSTVAWLLLGLFGPVDGFWMSALSETLSAICLAGLGSAMLLLLPVMSLPGRAVLEWSPTIWLGSTVIVATMASGMITGEQFPVLLVAGGAAAVAVVSVATWGWVRFVEPTGTGIERSRGSRG